jgi:hypothetical protein
MVVVEEKGTEVHISLNSFREKEEKGTRTCAVQRPM